MIDVRPADPGDSLVVQELLSQLGCAFTGCQHVATDLGAGAGPTPVRDQAVRMWFGRPGSAMRLGAWTATRSPSPVACLNRPASPVRRAQAQPEQAGGGADQPGHFRRVDPAYAEGVASAVARTKQPANPDPVSALQKPTLAVAETAE